MFKFMNYKMSNVKVELDSLLTDEQLANCPVVILGNKIDRPGAAGEDELRYRFKGTCRRNEMSWHKGTLALYHEL